MRRKWVLHGTVQGVGYRQSTLGEPQRLGLSGWVKNCADGSVQLEAEGSAEALAALERWCRTGPPGSKVTAVTAMLVDETTGALLPFVILR